MWLLLLFARVVHVLVASAGPLYTLYNSTMAYVNGQAHSSSVSAVETELVGDEAEAEKVYKVSARPCLYGHRAWVTKRVGFFVDRR